MAGDVATSASVAICGLLGQGINLCESAQCRREQILTPLISSTLCQTFVIPARAEIAILTIVALLSIRDARAFAQFEKQAMTIMAAHGGHLETAFRPSSTNLKQTPRVDEVHVLKFPDLDAFERYKKDGRLKSLDALRERAICATTVYVSAEEVRYPGPQ